MTNQKLDDGSHSAFMRGGPQQKITKKNIKWILLIFVFAIVATFAKSWFDKPDWQTYKLADIALSADFPKPPDHKTRDNMQPAGDSCQQMIGYEAMVRDTAADNSYSVGYFSVCA